MVSSPRRALATSSVLASASSASVTGSSRMRATSARRAAMPSSGVWPALMMAEVFSTPTCCCWLFEDVAWVAICWR